MHRRLLTLALATVILDLSLAAGPARAAPTPCEVEPASAGPDGLWGTADDTAPAVNCGGSFAPVQGSASVGEVSATQGATAIGQFVVVEPTTTGIDSNIGSGVTFPDASVAVGFRARVDGGRNVAVGANSRIGGSFGDFLSVEDSVAVGSTTVVTGSRATAIGAQAWTNADLTTIVGAGTFASGAGATVVGSYSGSSIEGAVAVGRSTFVNGPASGSISLNSSPVPDAIAGAAVGDRSRVSGDDGVALGGYAVVGVRNSFAMVGRGTAIGAGTLVSADGGTALGARAVSSATNSVALGAGSVADQANTVSVGTLGGERRVVNVADATGEFDAANLRQLQAGDAATLTAANTYTDAQIAASVGGSLAAANAYADAGDAATLTAANTYTDTQIAASSGAALATANAYADAGDVTTLASANAHTDAREAVIRDDMAAGDAATLQSARSYAETTATQAVANARSYTDSVFAAFNADLDAFRNDVDDRFRQQDRRMDRLAATSGAYAGMAMNTAGLGGRNRIGVGVGAQSGETALAIGYQRAVGDRASVSIGGALGGGEKSVMGGAGFSW